MLGRILCTGAVAATLSACALLQPFESQTTQQGHPTRNVAEQDPYWQRFYELEQQIAQLKASNARLQRQLAPADPVYTAAAPPASVNVGEFSPSGDSSAASDLADDILARVRDQADRAIAALDRAMASLAQPPAQPEPAPLVMAQASIPGIQGNLVRNDAGEVVKHTTYSESRKARYNFSVVYVYPEPQPWNDMWDKLEAANEQDKWRGFNGNRTRYFIYVGAYYSQLDAEQRQEALFALVGERPDLRERAQNQVLAAK